ncbi:XylR N-terminal domain-containing protein [Nannocystis pusilla]|uniref:XylR N-terminal domain-containing protein n=1 Tax=Nannocystis pusilla TaxID=889268 RepID=UPI003B7B1CB6
MSEENPFVAAGDDDALRLPDSADLLKHLRFSPRDGRITLGDERMVLVHVGALAALRRELIAALGVARARAVFTRMGYVSGQRDGEHARRVRGTASYYDLFAAGPQLHALEGMVAVRPLEVQFDIERGHYRGEFAWRSSAEVEAHLGSEGRAAEPVCWTLIGYASGFTTVFMGRPIVYREVACRACGARHCRIVGRPLGDGPPPPEFEFLTTEPLTTPSAGEAATPPARAEGPVIGCATGLRAAWALVERVAGAELPVLLEGEPGVGKRHLARAVHDRSRRAAGPFVVVRAGALDRSGLADALARARGGSLLVADLDRLAPDLQDSLLHALDTGDHDLRWLASTRVDLRRGGLVRDELVQRLGAFPIWLPRCASGGGHPAAARPLPRSAGARARAAPGRRHRGGQQRPPRSRLPRQRARAVGSGRPRRGPRRRRRADRSRPPLRRRRGSARAPRARARRRAAADPARPRSCRPGRRRSHRRPARSARRHRGPRAGPDPRRGRARRGNLAAAARLLGLTRPQLAYRFRKTDG